MSLCSSSSLPLCETKLASVVNRSRLVGSCARYRPAKLLVLGPFFNSVFLSGFSTSHSSPCSSYDSSENIYQSDNFGSDSFSEVPSPVMKHHVENPSPSHNEEGSPTMLTMFQQNKSENQNEDRHIGSHRNASESDTMTGTSRMKYGKGLSTSSGKAVKQRLSSRKRFVDIKLFFNILYILIAKCKLISVDSQIVQ